jgi:proline racemase
MRWSRTLQLVDVHCEGEIGRVVTGGVLDIPGLTMMAKLNHLNTLDDSFRKLLTSEPRSGPAGSVVLLTPPTHPDADTGMIILQPDQAHAMSGSNAICAVTALIETGMVTVTEPKTVVTIDTAAGLVKAVAECRDGRCQRVTLDMPTAFVEALDATIETNDWGTIRYDLCFGGVFYALVDVDQLGMKIDPSNARNLANAGVELRNAIDATENIVHPTIPEISGLAYVMFRDDDPDGAVRTCTTLRPGRADRSPCGTGSSANVASLFARGRATPGDVFRSRSIIGGEFDIRFIESDELAGRKATKSQISGRAWIYGISQMGLDPSDPFPTGFRLSDTWGALSEENLF